MRKKLFGIIKCLLLCIIALNVNAKDILPLNPIRLSNEALFKRALENADVDSFVLAKGDTMYLSNNYVMSKFTLINRGTIIIRDTAALAVGCNGKLMNDGALLNNGTLSLGTEGKFGLVLFCTGENPTIVNNGVINNNGKFEQLTDEAIVENNNLIKCTEAAHKNLSGNICPLCHDDNKLAEKQIITISRGLDPINGAYIKFSNGKEIINFTEKMINDASIIGPYSDMFGLDLNKFAEKFFFLGSGTFFMNDLELTYTQPEKDAFFSSTPRLIFDENVQNLIISGKCSTNMPILCKDDYFILECTYEYGFPKPNEEFEQFINDIEHKTSNDDQTYNYLFNGSFSINNNTTFPAIEAKELSVGKDGDLRIKSSISSLLSCVDVYNHHPYECRYSIEGTDYDRKIREEQYTMEEHGFDYYSTKEIFTFDKDKYIKELHISAKEPLYDVTFVDDDENVLKVEKVKFREQPTTQKIEKEGFSFIKFVDEDGETVNLFPMIEDDVTYRALFEPISGIDEIDAEQSMKVQKIYDETNKRFIMLMPNGKMYDVMGVEVK